MDRDLEELVSLFNLKVVGEDSHLLSNKGGIPTIEVQSGDGDETVLIKLLRQRFYTTDKVDGVPMRFAGEGIWRYCIDI